MRNSHLGVQVIARAADVLRALEGNDQGLSLGQLARQLNLPKSTVQRIVAALDSENFVIAASPQAGVRLGPALIRIARSVRYGLVDIARPCLEELAQRTGETVDLALLKGAEAVFMDHIEGAHRLRAVSATRCLFSAPLQRQWQGNAIRIERSRAGEDEEADPPDQIHTELAQFLETVAGGNRKNPPDRHCLRP